MDIVGFRQYLEKGGRTASAVNRCIRFVSGLENYLSEDKHRTNLDDVQGKDLTDFILWLDDGLKSKANGYLWAIRYYCDYRSNPEIRDLAEMLRSERIERKPLSLSKLRV